MSTDKARRGPPPIALVAASVVFAISIAIGLLFLAVRIFSTSATITVDNRTPLVTKVSVGDADIGCYDDATVGAHATSSVAQSLHGQFLGILCMGDAISVVTISNESGGWSCDWREVDRHRPIVVTDSGPNCPVLPQGFPVTPDRT